ncbi:MAG: hypothetical protein ACWGOX_15985, partial [Desulforhopalus sp.]
SLIIRRRGEKLRESTFLTDFDRFLIGEGSHERTYEKLGAHPGKKLLFMGGGVRSVAGVEF